jgi:hypothetical protein
MNIFLVGVNTGDAIMRKVKVYQFTIYDIGSDGEQKSRRWATREAIKLRSGTVIENTATEVDESVLNSDVEGMTRRDFDPHATVGFQRQVRR